MKPKIILCLAVVLSGGLFGCSTHPSALPLRYHNAQYGLTFFLPAGWTGYSVLMEEWNAELHSAGHQQDLGTVHGPIVLLRHPQWKAAKPYQDIPIMVLTSKQWEEEHQGRFFPYAGGVISEMWHSRRYVFGLYSRYNAHDEVKGWEEVAGIVERNCAASTAPHLYPE